MVKLSEETKKKGSFLCPGCKQEFDGGSECPNCGNSKGNIKLASDGIDQGLHTTERIFPINLKPTEEYLDNARILERKRAAMQMEEMDDNLREAYVLKSKTKLIDLEMQRRRKEIEAKRLEESSEDYVSGRSGPPPAQSANPQMESQIPQMPPFMSNMSPQAMFMQQLMRMDSKKRAEFIEQLSDADPAALTNLSSMFQQAMPQQQQQSQYPPNYPMMPPWMMPQQQLQPQQPQTNPIELVAAIFELSQKMQPQRDDSMKEALSEFKNSIQKVHDRIDTIVTKERERDTNPILDKINNLEHQINSGGRQKSVVDQVTELTTLVEGLEKAGLVKRSGSADKTVDDELKIKEFEFRRETENRKIELEESRAKAEQTGIELKNNIVSSLLQRGIQKNIQAREGEEEPTKHINKVQLRPQAAPSVRQEPVEVIDEVKAEAGVIRETRRPVKRVELGSD